MAGIDFGNMSCYTAVAKNDGKIESKLDIPSCVSFGQSARLVGDEARQHFDIHFHNSVVNFKHLLGREPSDPVVNTFSAFIPSEIVNHPSGSVAFKVIHLGEQRVFTVEQILVCLFTHLRSLMNKSLGGNVTESVLNVPFFFGQKQRIAILTAGEVAGMKFRLINDHTAFACTYHKWTAPALPKSEEQPKLVAFIDCGHSAVQASVVAFNADRAEVLGAEYDLGVGGLHFDALIRDQFAAEFNQQYGIDARTNARAWLRLMDECEKLKKQMQKKTEAEENSHQSFPLYIECFMNDVDVSGNMSREQFEKLAESLFEKYEALLQRLIETSKVQSEDIDQVILTGGSSRVLRIRELTKDFFGGREPNVAMTRQAKARGCVLFAMNCSEPQFRMVDKYAVSIPKHKLPKEEPLTVGGMKSTERMDRIEEMGLLNNNLINHEVLPLIRTINIRLRSMNTRLSTMDTNITNRLDGIDSRLNTIDIQRGIPADVINNRKIRPGRCCVKRMC